LRADAMPSSSISNFVDVHASKPLHEHRNQRGNVVGSSAWSTQEIGLTVWFTGPSGAGKTTLANAVAKHLREDDVLTVLLDENILNEGFCAGLGFSREDRAENVRRISELARRLSARGAVVLVAAVAPYRDTRLAARKCIGGFIEVYVNASPACVEHYEAPLDADIECRTEVQSVDDCATVVMTAVRAYRHIAAA
jgi:adenylylsulfate kinase